VTGVSLSGQLSIHAGTARLDGTIAVLKRGSQCEEEGAKVIATLLFSPLAGEKRLPQ